MALAQMAADSLCHVFKGKTMKVKLFLALAVSCLLFLTLSCGTTPGTTTPPTTTSPSTTSPTTVDLENLEWSFSGLTVKPSEAVVGEEVEVSIWVQVLGVVQLPARVVLAIDGEIVATKRIYLEEDYSYLVSFTITLDEVGTHEVRVGAILERYFENYEVGADDFVANLTIRPAQE